MIKSKKDSEEEFIMIDIHSHILPGLDDGAKNVEDSIAMAKQAVEQGFDTIIATPHHRNGSYENYKTDILAQVKLVNDALQILNQINYCH